MLERGVVRVVHGDLAEVEIRPASEEACATCGTCEEGPQGRLLTVDRRPGMEPGARVVLEVREATGLGPPVVAFLLPVVAIIGGAILGAEVPGWLGRPGFPRTLATLLGAALLLVLAVALIRRYDLKLRRKRFGPRVVRIES